METASREATTTTCDDCDDVIEIATLTQRDEAWLCDTCVWNRDNPDNDKYWASIQEPAQP